MTLRTTHTLATLEVSQEVFDRIYGKLHEAGYEHALIEKGMIDMTGIALVPPKPALPEPKKL